MIIIDESSSFGSSSNEGKRCKCQYNKGRIINGYIEYYNKSDDSYYIYFDDGTRDDSFPAKFVKDTWEMTANETPLALFLARFRDSSNKFDGFFLTDEDFNTISKSLGKSPSYQLNTSSLDYGTKGNFNRISRSNSSMINLRDNIYEISDELGNKAVYIKKDRNNGYLYFL